jgi:hypothetical protein
MKSIYNFIGIHIYVFMNIFHLERSSSEKHLSVVDLSLRGLGRLRPQAAGHFLCFTLFFLYISLHSYWGGKKKKGAALFIKKRGRKKVNRGQPIS